MIALESRTQHSVIMSSLYTQYDVGLLEVFLYTVLDCLRPYVCRMLWTEMQRREMCRARVMCARTADV